MIDQNVNLDETIQIMERDLENDCVVTLLL